MLSPLPVFLSNTDPGCERDATTHSAFRRQPLGESWEQAGGTPPALRSSSSLRSPALQDQPQKSNSKTLQRLR